MKFNVGINNDRFFFKFRAQIRNQAHLVLEENKMLSQQYDLQEKKLVEIQKTHIQEIGRLSKRVIVCEAERVSLLNEIDQLRANNEEMLKKYNEYSIEAQRRIKLEDHLNQVGDLKR
jgi:predicted secreted Zn-dependent protease